MWRGPSPENKAVGPLGAPGRASPSARWFGGGLSALAAAVWESLGETWPDGQTKDDL